MAKKNKKAPGEEATVLTAAMNVAKDNAEEGPNVAKDNTVVSKKKNSSEVTLVPMVDITKASVEPLMVLNKKPSKGSHTNESDDARKKLKGKAVMEEGGEVARVHSRATLSDVDEEIEVEFPPLKPRVSKPEANGRLGTTPNNEGGKSETNVWARRSERVFMNSGLGGRLEYVKPTSTKVQIKCSEALPKQQVWGWSLLGQYVGFFPGYFAINELRKSWGVKSRYREEAGWMVFQFESEDAYEKVLKGGPYFINGKPLLLRPVPDKFAFNRKEIATIPLWVRIFGLPVVYWTKEVLGRVASHVGKPLYTDKVTEDRKRGSYARVLVEVNFANPITRALELEFDDGDTLACTFLIENEPLYCAECCTFGHKMEECSFKEKRVAVGVNARSTYAKGSAAPKGKDLEKVNPRLEGGSSHVVKGQNSRKAGVVSSSTETPKGLASSESGGKGSKGGHASASRVHTQVLTTKKSTNKSETQSERDKNKGSETHESKGEESCESSEEDDSSLDVSSSDEDDASTEEDDGSDDSHAEDVGVEEEVVEKPFVEVVSRSRRRKQRREKSLEPPAATTTVVSGVICEAKGTERIARETRAMKQNRGSTGNSEVSL